MDTQFIKDAATLEERQAVDSVIGPPQSGWSGGARNADLDGHFAVRAHSLGGQRHQLLPVLHSIQARFGWITPTALNYACQRLDVPPAEAYGVASFYGLFSLTQRPPLVVHVCDDIACMTHGAEDLCSQMEIRLGPPGSTSPDGRSTWLRSPCLGLCERAPAAMVTFAGEKHGERIIAPAISDEIVTELGEFDPGKPGDAPDKFLPSVSIPQSTGSAQSNLMLLSRAGQIDPENIEDYLAHGGYEALQKALDLGGSWVVTEVLASKLVGRGGAAFPTGKKWDTTNKPQYLICNADESEPGTFKDRVVMEADPFALVEAMTITGCALGCKRGYIYLRGEYPLAGERLDHAIKSARERGFLGNNILGRGIDFDIEIRRGAGAYICGEETALFNSIEGFRGEPRSKPPFPTQAGLFGKPTVVNNVETLINVLLIVREGGEKYAAIGTKGSAGPKLFCLSGHIVRPGVYEVPFGTTLRELIDLAGGVGGSGRLQAILLGGAAGAFVSPEELDTPLTFEGTRAVNATLGSGVVMLFDDTVDLRKILYRIAAFFRDESCGQCVPCRIGTVRQEELLQRCNHGRPHESVEGELRLLKEVGQVMRDASICGLGQTASSAIESALRRWRLF